MKYIDFGLLWKSKKTPIYLPPKAAKFLLGQKVSYLSSKSKLNFLKKFTFSHDLVLSGKNQWHIIEKNKKGEGACSSVHPAHYKIVVAYDTNTARYTAQLIPVDDVVKIQLVPPGTPYAQYCDLTEKEAAKQQQHGVNVVAVVGAKNKTMIIVENCGLELQKLFGPMAVNRSFKFRLEVAARIATEMLLLQQNGVIHRDLKPSNICYKSLEHGYRFAFIDFGYAEDVGFNDNSSWSGTWEYMAPEVVRGESGTHQADMYALAGILGLIFGAWDVNKYRRKIASLLNTGINLSRLNALIKTPFCFEGLFEEYNLSQIDPFILEDIRFLLNGLQSLNPQNRPTIHQVNKFFITLPARMDAYQAYNENCLALRKEIDKFNKQNELIIPLIKHMPEYEKRLKNEKDEIEREIKMIPKPKSHYQLSRTLIAEERSADFSNQDNPYADLSKPIQLLQEANAILKASIDQLNALLQSAVVYEGQEGNCRMVVSAPHPDNAHYHEERYFPFFDASVINRDYSNKQKNDDFQPVSAFSA